MAALARPVVGELPLGQEHQPAPPPSAAGARSRPVIGQVGQPSVAPVAQLSWAVKTLVEELAALLAPSETLFLMDHHSYIFPFLQTMDIHE